LNLFRFSDARNTNEINLVLENESFDIFLILFSWLVQIESDTWQVDGGILLQIPAILALYFDHISFDTFDDALKFSIGDVNRLLFSDWQWISGCDRETVSFNFHIAYNFQSLAS
jgi:hypothetical protein